MIAGVSRTILGLFFYIGGGLFHLYLIATERYDLYYLFGEAPLLPFYGTLWETVVLPALPWVVVPVILFEWAIGLMMLETGRRARAGQAAGAVWNLLLAPFGPWGWTNLILATVHVWLSTQEFERSAWQVRAQPRW